MRTLLNPFADRIAFRRPDLAASPRENRRRELMGLIGATLIFFVGLPGHSSTYVASAQHMARSLVKLVLIFLGLASPSPVSQINVARLPAPLKHEVPVVKIIRTPRDFNVLSTYSHYRLYTYKFEGTAKHQGAACPNASILVRVISNEETITRGGITAADGTFSIEVPVRAKEGIPVDWKVEAFTPEFEKIEMAGRRIVQQEEEQASAPVVVTSAFEFVPSL